VTVRSWWVTLSLKSPLWDVWSVCCLLILWLLSLGAVPRGAQQPADSHLFSDFLPFVPNVPAGVCMCHCVCLLCPPLLPEDMVCMMGEQRSCLPRGGPPWHGAAGSYTGNPKDHQSPGPCENPLTLELRDSGQILFFLNLFYFIFYYGTFKHPKVGRSTQ
jgi:hypothetical protein